MQVALRRAQNGSGANNVRCVGRGPAAQGGVRRDGSDHGVLLTGRAYCRSRKTVSLRPAAVYLTTLGSTGRVF